MMAEMPLQTSTAVMLTSLRLEFVVLGLFFVGFVFCCFSLFVWFLFLSNHSQNSPTSEGGDMLHIK